MQVLPVLAGRKVWVYLSYLPKALRGRITHAFSSSETHVMNVVGEELFLPGDAPA